MTQIKFDVANATTTLEKRSRGWINKTVIPAAEGNMRLAIETSKDCTTSCYPRTIAMCFTQNGSLQSVAYGRDFYAEVAAHTEVTRSTKATILRLHQAQTTPEALEKLVAIAEQHYAGQS